MSPQKVAHITDPEQLSSSFFFFLAEERVPFFFFFLKDFLTLLRFLRGSGACACPYLFTQSHHVTQLPVHTSLDSGNGSLVTPTQKK